MTETATGAFADPFGWAGATLDGKYRIDAVVGEGGFGVVYRGQHLGFGEPIAVKCLKLDDAIPEAKRKDFLRNFIVEGRLLYRLSSLDRNIVRAIDVGAATSPRGAWTPYLVLEWVHGKTLEDVLADRRARGLGGLSLAEAIALLDPVARALAVAHEEGVAHRDVKPGNLLVTELRSGLTIKVLDFGVAKVMSEAASATQATTGLSARAFSPPYAAPEQFDARMGATGPWTDVFALALVLVEVVCGRRAFPEHEAMQLYMRASDPARRPTLRAMGIPTSDEVERVLQRALAVDPRNRFANASEFWSRLREAAGVPVSSDGGNRRVTRTVDETELPALTEGPVRTEIPAVVPTVQQGPAPDIHLARESAVSGSISQPKLRAARGCGCVPFVFGGALVFAAAAAAALYLFPERLADFLPVPTGTPVPSIAPPPAPASSSMISALACVAPCCGGSECRVDGANSSSWALPKFCHPGSSMCEPCPGAPLCLPGNCADQLEPHAHWRIKMMWIHWRGPGESICLSKWSNASICIESFSRQRDCIRAEETCGDGGATSPLHLTTEELVGGTVRILLTDPVTNLTLAEGRLPRYANQRKFLCEGFSVELKPTTSSTINGVGFLAVPEH